VATVILLSVFVINVGLFGGGKQFSAIWIVRLQ